jgi:hypothetical protein
MISVGAMVVSLIRSGRGSDDNGFRSTGPELMEDSFIENGTSLSYLSIQHTRSIHRTRGYSIGYNGCIFERWMEKDK